MGSMTKWVPSSSTTTPPCSSQSRGALGAGQHRGLRAPLGLDGGRRERRGLDDAGERGPPGRGVEQVVGRAAVGAEPAAPADPAGRDRAVARARRRAPARRRTGRRPPAAAAGRRSAGRRRSRRRSRRAEPLGDQVGEQALGQPAAVEARRRAGGVTSQPSTSSSRQRECGFGAAGRRAGASRSASRAAAARGGRRRSRRPRSRPAACRRRGRRWPPPPRGRPRPGAPWSVLTGTTSRGSAFRRESSLAGRKRLKRTCQFSMQRRASSSAAGVAAQTPQREPKQSNLMRRCGGRGEAAHEQRAGGDHDERGREQEPGGAGVGAHHQRVADAEHPGQRGEAMQLAPALRADARRGRSRRGRGSRTPSRATIPTLIHSRS